MNNNLIHSVDPSGRPIIFIDPLGDREILNRIEEILKSQSTLGSNPDERSEVQNAFDAAIKKTGSSRNPLA